MQSSSRSSDSLFSAFVPLLPLMAAVFLAFFVSGMAFPIVPRHVHDTLGFGTLLVGVTMGAQYLSSIVVGRLWSGHFTDERGAKPAMAWGALGISGVGLAYLASLAVVQQPSASLGVLIAGRLLTGIAEAFIITSSLSWGIARTGPAHTGKVIGWIGMALFAAYGVGAMAGAAVHARFGFAGIAVATIVVPLLALATVLRIPGVAPTHMQRPAFYKVVGLVKLPGLALTLSSFGYAAINAFIALLWLQRGWGTAGIAFMAMGIGFIASRLLVGHLPDKLGGAKVAGICVAAEAIGQLLIWWTSIEWVACIGAALTGAGYALAFQGFGVEAVHRAPPESRGSAMGGYVAFQDLSMALAGPLGGWLALHAGLASVYMAGSLTAVASVLLAWWMVAKKA
jgi:MFS family permease